MLLRSKSSYRQHLNFGIVLVFLALPLKLDAQESSNSSQPSDSSATPPPALIEDSSASSPSTPSSSAPASGISLSTDATPIDKIRNRELLLVVNVPRTIEFDYDIGEIAIGNPSIAAPILDRPRRRMIVSPLSPGQTAILLFDSRGIQRDKIELVVTSSDLDAYVKDLKFLLRDIEGLSFKRVGSRIIIEGEVFLQADLDRIAEVTAGNTSVVNLVGLSRDTQRILTRRIKNEINISGVEVENVRDRVVLKGEVATEQEKERAGLIAGIYVPADKIVNVIAVNPDRKNSRPARLVQISAHFVELNKSFMRNFSFSWAPVALAQTQVGPFPTPAGQEPFSFAAVLSDFLPRLSTAKALGVARVFHNPSVSVKSGEVAAINSGGQLFLQSVNQQGQLVTSGEPVPIGVTLNVTPTADERDFIDMKVSVSVRALGSSTAEVQGVIVNESSVDTSNYVRSGETVALGGVVKTSMVDIKDAPQPFGFQAPGLTAPVTPALGNIFNVFKSRAMNQDRSIFIVFVTPEILVSARDASKDIRQKINLDAVEPVAGDDEGGAN
jgi:pilus assembly protein CpaC